MSGQIPKYGEHFRRDSVPRDFQNDLAHTEYVSKRNEEWSIIGNGAGKIWWIFHRNEIIAGPFWTMTEAMNRCNFALWELYGDKLEARPNAVWGHKNRN